MTNTSHLPASLPSNYDVLRFWNDGSLLVGTSDLTGRYWTGTAARFADPNLAPDLNHCSVAKVVEAGISDGIVLQLDEGSNHKAVLAYDSGAIEVLEMINDETGESAPVFVTVAYGNEHDDAVSTLGVSCDRQKVVTGSYDKSIKIWSTDSWTSFATYPVAHFSHVLSVSCHPEIPDLIVSCSQDGRALLWDTREPRPASEIYRTSGAVPSAIAWQPSQGTKLVIGSEDGDVILKDVRNTAESLYEIKPHERNVTRLEFNPMRSKVLAVCANETTVTVLNLEDDDRMTVFYTNDEHTDFVQGLAWCPNTNLLYTCGWDSTIRRHKVPSS